MRTVGFKSTMKGIFDRITRVYVVISATIVKPAIVLMLFLFLLAWLLIVFPIWPCCGAPFSRVVEDSHKRCPDRVLSAKKIRVAVIDSGINSTLVGESFLCQEGHRDFTGTSMHDSTGHGTHVSGLIDQHVKQIFLDNAPISRLLAAKAPYCQVVLKVFDPLAGSDGLSTTLNALRYAMDMGVDYINYSAGGSHYSLEEHLLVKNILDRGIVMVVAAGNNSRDIVVDPYYPAALDSRLIVVGNYDGHGKRSPSSNFGSIVDAWEIGMGLTSLYSKTLKSISSGTSQATAVHTGKLIRRRILDTFNCVP